MFQAAPDDGLERKIGLPHLLEDESSPPALDDAHGLDLLDMQSVSEFTWTFDATIRHKLPSTQERRENEDTAKRKRIIRKVAAMPSGIHDMEGFIHQRHFYDIKAVVHQTSFDPLTYSPTAHKFFDWHQNRQIHHPTVYVVFRECESGSTILPSFP